MEELKDHITSYGLTKRSVACILMGTLRDPLQLLAPYINNLKLIYRNICRLKIDWDQTVPEKIQERIVEVLSFFFEMDKIQFTRKAVFMDAAKIKFKVYFDGSKQCIGVSAVVKNVLPNGKVIYRLLCNKSKICGEDINTAPRSELTACLVITRVYILIKEELSF